MDQVWSIICLDLITNLPETPCGNKHIIVCVCTFSKWPEAKAISDKSAQCVYEFLSSLIYRHGCPTAVITDQGREFCNQLVDGFLTSMNVEHRTSSAYHPPTNGQVERFNQTLKNALRKMVDESLNNWDLLIDPILFAYRTSRQVSTRFTPFFLVNG
jgi:hypothetical protein